MIVQLQKIQTTVGDDSHVSPASSAEPPMIADHVNISPLPPARGTNRRLRNWFILANLVAWVLIVWAIRLIFF